MAFFSLLFSYLITIIVFMISADLQYIEDINLNYLMF